MGKRTRFSEGRRAFEDLASNITADLGAGLESYALCLMTTQSMAPAVRRGDLLLIERSRKLRLRPGDILLLRGTARQWPNYSHRLIRIVRKGGRRFVITKGDAKYNYDQPVAVEAVLGRAAYVRRGDRGWFSLNSVGVRAAGRLTAWLFRLLLAASAAGEPPSRWTLLLRSWNDLGARWFCRCLERAPAPQLSGTPPARSASSHLE